MEENRIRLPAFAALPDRMEESEVADIEAGSSLDFLQSVYRDPCQPISRRMRAAVAALPFEHPKLAVTATLGPNSGFAARLETAIKRSRELVVIDAEPVADDMPITAKRA